MSPKPIKPQPTLKGYNAWAFTRLITILGISQAEGASWIIERWLWGMREYLDQEYGISPKKYRAERGLDELTGGATES